MSSLKTVIRLHKWQLDEKRRALAELQNLHDRLVAEMHRLQQEMLYEQQVARADPMAAFGYAAFAKAAMERGKRLQDSIAQVEQQIAVATEEMAEAFQELKRFELAEEERLKREREKIRRKEEAMLDETALVGFRRRQEQESAGR
ncbi:flagellar FliJ family protein [Azospirillum sp.]|uniref:flagellar FliJ family protein n=1 Tax=Azospirillum sp. TaxID=34012 RepID=UPI003D747EA3